MLAVLDDAARLVVGDAGGGQQGGAAALVEQLGLAGSGVAGADDLLGGGGDDVLGAQEVVEPAILQFLERGGHGGRHEVGEHRDRLAVGAADAGAGHDGGALLDLEVLGGLRIGLVLGVVQHGGGGGVAGGGQV